MDEMESSLEMDGAGCGGRKSVTYLLCELELSSFGWPTILMNLKVNPVIIGKVQDLADFPHTQKKSSMYDFFSCYRK